MSRISITRRLGCWDVCQFYIGRRLELTTERYIIMNTLLAALQAVEEYGDGRLIVKRVDASTDTEWLQSMEDNYLLIKDYWLTYYLQSINDIQNTIELQKRFYQDAKLGFDTGYCFLDKTRIWQIDWSVNSSVIKRIPQEDRIHYNDNLQINNIYEAYQEALISAIIEGGKYCERVIIETPNSVKNDSEIVGTYRQRLQGERLEPEYWKKISFENVRNAIGLRDIIWNLYELGIIFEVDEHSWWFDWTFTIEDNQNTKKIKKK